MDLGRRPEI